MENTVDMSKQATAESILSSVRTEVSRDFDVNEFADDACRAVSHLFAHSDWTSTDGNSDKASLDIIGSYASWGSKFGIPGGSRSDYIGDAVYRACSDKGIVINSVDGEATAILLSEIAESVLYPSYELDCIRESKMSGILDHTALQLGR